MKARFLALAALVLGLASCQQEFNDVAQLGGEVDYQLKVDAAELATRAGINGESDSNNAYDSAFGAIDYLQAVNDEGEDIYRVDWTEVDLRYSLEVYDAGVNYDNTDVKPVKDRMVKIVDAYEQVVFDLRLVPGRDYRFVVFADFVPNGEYDKEINPSIEAQRNLGLRHRIGDDLRDITIIERDINDAVANQINDEIGDAYFYTDVVADLQTNSSHDVTLQRPYGKIRVIATDLAELNLNVEPKSVKVQYESSRPVGFNAVTGKVTSDQLLEETTYFSVYNEGVCKLIDIDKDANGLANHFYNAGYDNATTENADGVKRHTHMTLFTDYILGSHKEGEQTPVHFTMSVYDDKDGQSLIKETIFNTTIPIERNHLTTIVGNVLTSATEITVTIDDNFANADNTTEAPFYQQTISSEAELLAAIEANSGEYILVSNIEVNGIPASTLAATRSTGNGTTINLNDKIIILKTDITIAEDKTLTITDNGQIIKDGGQIVNNGTLNIEGGNFGKETIENNGSANVSGGTFADDAIVNNGSVSVEGENSGEEDRIIENGTDAVVTNIVYTVAELQDALDEGKVDEIIFGADLVGEEVIISQREGVNVYINGAGKKFDGTIKIYGNSRYTGAERLKIANINFETETAKDFIWSDKGDDNVMRYAHNVTIENCTFNGVEGQAIVGMRLRQAYNVTVKNCQAENVHSLIQNSSANGLKIDNVRVNGLTGINILAGGNVEISNSVITATEQNGFAVRADGNNPGSMKISTCTFSADRPVIVRKLKSTYNLTFEGKNTLKDHKRYQVVLINNDQDDQAYVVPTGTYTLTGADKFVVFPHTWWVSDADELQNAINSVKADVTINFANKIKGNVYIAQKENIDIVIDGKNKQFDGGFIVDGKNRNNGAETILFKNINFYTESTDEKTFISCPKAYNGVDERYSHNVTIDNCTFRASSLTENVGAISAQKTYHLAVKNCEAYNIHSLLQVQSCDNDVTVENVKVENCFSGISVGNTKTTTISGANIKTQKYGIRLDGETTRKVTVNVANSNIEAYIPIVARKVITDSNVEVNLSETTLVEKNNDMYDVVFQNNKDYEDGNVTPVTPTGNWKITGADDYIVYPREVYVAPGFYQTSNGYTIKNAAENSTITLADDVNGTISIEKVKDITIEGNENTNVRFVTTANSKLENVTIKNAKFEFVTGAGQAGAFVVINKDAQIDNLVIEGCNIVGDEKKNSYGITGQNPNASIVVKGCNFSKLGYAIQAIAGGGYASLTVENCSFANINSWVIMPQYGYNGDLTVTGCTFDYCSDGIIKTGAFNGKIFTFTNNVITNSAGHDGKDSKWFEVNASAATKVVSGNTKDGVEWTPGSEQGLK